MRALGAEVRAVTSGSATLKDAINEAMRDWVTNVATTHYVLGSAVGPHPYPPIVRDLQRVIGDEAAAQLARVEGRLPDVAIACVGGGSNAIGLLSRFIGEPAVRLVGVEAAGEGSRPASTRRRSRAARRACSTARARTCSRTPTARSRKRTRSRPASTTRASARSSRRCSRRTASRSCRRPTTRRSRRPRAGAHGGHPSGARTGARDRGARRLAGGPTELAPLPDDALVLLGLSGRGDKDLAAIEDSLMREWHA